ncbi:MAG: hypothetical protein ACI4QE_02970 [Acutalibacteraceae bacterium]
MDNEKIVPDEIINLDDLPENAIYHERYDKKTPNGGDYSEIFYLDENGKGVDKNKATRAVIYECKKDGTAINRTFLEKKKK